MTAYPTFPGGKLRLKPYGSEPIENTKTFAFLDRDKGLLNGSGERFANLSELPPRTTVYSLNVPLRDVPEMFPNDSFSAGIKRRKPKGILSLNIDGKSSKIVTAPSKPDSVSRENYMAAYDDIAEYLASKGVNYSGPPSASIKLFRQGLTETIELSSPVGRGMTRGSRGLAYPGFYPGPWTEYDMRSAYPSAMQTKDGLLPSGAIPLTNPKDWRKPEHGSLVFARVIILATLPHKSPVILQHPKVDGKHAFDPVTVMPERELFDWFFDFELDTIEERGHYVEPIYSFELEVFDATGAVGRYEDVLGVRYNDDWFTPWHRKLLKQIANCFWGGIVTGQILSRPMHKDSEEVVGDMGIVFNPDFNKGQEVRSSFPGYVGGETLSAWINAKVSDRVFKEFIEPYNPVYFDTDGGFINAGQKGPPLGTNIGSWTKRGTYNDIEIAGWQAYAAAHSGLTAGAHSHNIKVSGVEGRVSYQDFKRLSGSPERAQRVSIYHPDPYKDKVYAVHKTQNAIRFNIPGNFRIEIGDWILLPPKLAPDAVKIVPREARFVKGRKRRIDAYVQPEIAAKLRELAKSQNGLAITS